MPRWGGLDMTLFARSYIFSFLAHSQKVKTSKSFCLVCGFHPLIFAIKETNPEKFLKSIFIDPFIKNNNKLTAF